MCLCWILNAGASQVQQTFAMASQRIKFENYRYTVVHNFKETATKKSVGLFLMSSKVLLKLNNKTECFRLCCKHRPMYQE